MAQLCHEWFPASVGAACPACRQNGW
ncbi:hypothetical protein [Pseudocnuella soli]